MTGTLRIRRILAAVALAGAVWLGMSSPAFAQQAQSQTQTQAQTPPATTPPPLPPHVNLDRIRELASRPSTIRIDDGQMKIYVEVIANWPRFDEIVKGYDLANGPTRRGNPMTHQEFLNMVTPKELYSTTGIMPTDMLQIALTSWLIKAVIEKGLEDIKKAKSEAEVAEIRARIDRELAALKGGK